ncbi:MAG: hypothetical protein R2883_05155 [Caldisericia bacterium]
MTAFKKKLDIESEEPTDLNGIPVLMNLNLWFYATEDAWRVKDVWNLWDFFRTAIEFSDKWSDDVKSSFIESYDKVIKQKQVKWNLTMGLFWI